MRLRAPRPPASPGASRSGRGRGVAGRRAGQEGAALFLVTVLMLVLVVVVMELGSTAQVQVAVARNLTDRHLSFYVEETAVIKTEEFLWQDLNPPPVKPDRYVTEAQLLVEQRQKKSDSFHDFWAGADHVEQVGEVWVRTRVGDEERKFNVNSIVDPKSGTVKPLQADFLKQLLKVAGLKEAEIPELVARIADYIDKDEQGAYEEGARNGPMHMVRELYAIKGVGRTLFSGSRFPRGEVVLSEELDRSTEAFPEEAPPEELPEGAAPKARDPFAAGKAARPVPPEDWEDEGIRPGLQDLLTVYGAGLVNLNTAPLPVLEALFESREVAIDVVKARKKAPFDAFEQVQQVPGAAPGLQKYRAMLGFTSSFFRADMEFARERVMERKFVVLRRGDGQVVTLFKGGSP